MARRPLRRARATSSTRPTSWSPGSTRHLCAADRGDEPARHRAAAAAASTPRWRRRRCRRIVAGVDSDRLYPLRPAGDLADGLPGCAGCEVVALPGRPRRLPHRGRSRRQAARPRRWNWPAAGADPLCGTTPARTASRSRAGRSNRQHDDCAPDVPPAHAMSNTRCAPRAVPTAPRQHQPA